MKVVRKIFYLVLIIALAVFSVACSQKVKTIGGTVIEKDTSARAHPDPSRGVPNSNEWVPRVSTSNPKRQDLDYNRWPHCAQRTSRRRSSQRLHHIWPFTGRTPSTSFIPTSLHSHKAARCPCVGPCPLWRPFYTKRQWNKSLRKGALQNKSQGGWAWMFQILWRK